VSIGILRELHVAALRNPTSLVGNSEPAWPFRSFAELSVFYPIPLAPFLQLVLLHLLCALLLRAVELI